MRYFIAVAEERSFLKAADRLHISQPPLSTQIKQLEDQLGVTLLVRSSKGISLTEPGKVFYAEARAVVARVEQARISTQRAARGEEGRLAIGFVSIVDYSFLPAGLKAFRQCHPRVEVQLHELTTDAQLKELAHENLDVGLALAPIEGEGVQYHHLSTEELVLAVAVDHPLAGVVADEIAIKDLSGESFVMVPRPMAPGYYDTFTAFCRSNGFTPRIEQSAKQMQTVISLVANNFGIAVVPASLRNLQRTGVTYRSFYGQAPTIDIGLVHRRTDANPAISSFLAVLRETVASLSGSPAVPAARADSRLGQADS